MNGENVKKTRVFIFFITAGLGLAALCWPAGAEASDRINFQGKLRDSVTKNPKNGLFDMTFRICDSAAAACTAGALLWTETQSNVSVSNGLFSVQLGSFTPIGASVFSAPARYLEIAVAGETFSPRERLAAAPYSFRASVAESIAYNTVSTLTVTGGDFSVGGSTLVVKAGNVGIGTAAPDATLQVAGTVKMFGAWAGMTVDTVYQAATDGFVVAHLYAELSSQEAVVTAATDAANPPVTIRAAASTDFNANAVRNSLAMPVRKGDYWRINTISNTGATITVYWIPLGI